MSDAKKAKCNADVPLLQTKALSTLKNFLNFFQNRLINCLVVINGCFGDFETFDKSFLSMYCLPYGIFDITKFNL